MQSGTLPFVREAFIIRVINGTSSSLALFTTQDGIGSNVQLLGDEAEINLLTSSSVAHSKVLKEHAGVGSCLASLVHDNLGRLSRIPLILSEK